MAGLASGTGNKRAPLCERGDDTYETPPEAVAALLRVETLPHRIWEPCCASGNIVRVLRDAGHKVLGTDLRADHGCPQGIGGIDFLMEQPRFSTVVSSDAIVTNPPFKLAEPFVRQARRLVPKVYMLMRLAFYEADRRTGILEAGDLARIWVFRKRLPMMHRAGWEGRKANSGMAFAWFVWDREHQGPTTIGRLSWESAA